MAGFWDNKNKNKSYQIYKNVTPNYFFLCRKLTTQEILDIDENKDFWDADIYITPNTWGVNSEEDSDDWKAPSVNINYLSGRQ